MHKQKIQPLIYGSMIAGIFGVLAIINVYTGSTLDILFSYAMVLAMSWYASEYSWKYSLCLLLTSTIILFLAGQLFFLFFSIPTLLMGIYFGECYKRKLHQRVFNIGLFVISCVKNFFVFFLFGELLGYPILTEGQDILVFIEGLIPSLAGIISPVVLIIVLWFVTGIIEAYVVKMYSYLFFQRIIKKK